MPDLILDHLVVGPLACTCTIVADPARGEAIVIDGGAEAERIVARLAALGVRATTLLHTHAHIDHVGACAELRERTGARAALHPDDGPLYALLARQAELLGLPPVRATIFEDELREGDRIPLGAAHLEVLHTPGHTPGSVSFALHEGARVRLFSGDTLFAGAIGRWDLGGISQEAIVASIRARLLVYPDATPVVPGHGPHTTIGRERATNPFLA